MEERDGMRERVGFEDECYYVNNRPIAVTVPESESNEEEEERGRGGGGRDRIKGSVKVGVRMKAMTYTVGR